MNKKKTLLKFARDTIENYITKGIIPRFESDAPAFIQKAGAFVTINKKGELRGCVGLIG